MCIYTYFKQQYCEYCLYTKTVNHKTELHHIFMQLEHCYKINTYAYSNLLPYKAAYIFVLTNRLMNECFTL